MLLVHAGLSDRDPCGIDGGASIQLDTKGRKRIMTLNRVLALTSVALGALLVIQVALVMSRPPERRLHASWLNLANTLEEGAAQSDHVILGEVLEVRKGQDIVVPAPGEPNDEHRVPTQIVKLRVEKAYKGAPGEVVELFQTGQSTDAEVEPSPSDDTHGKSRAKAPQPTSGDARQNFLEDDPPYQVGEKYVLFLKDQQGAEGRPTGRKRALAPEGRYQVTKNDKLKPVTPKRGFAPKWIGRPLGDFEAEVKKFTP